MEWLKLRENGMKDKHIRMLMNEFDTFEEMYSKENFYLFNDKLKKFLEISYKTNISFLEEKYYKNKIKVLSKYSKEYPKSLLKMQDYPVFLYAKGQLLEEKTITNIYDRSIAIVGTRKVTKHGKVSCEKIVKELLEYDVTIISGLAEGIDTIALEMAINKNGNVIAVVGTGLDVIYPFKNKYLWDKISSEGILFSEYDLGTEPQKWNFPMRNRIISGISSGVLIAESYKKGGSLITAELAYNQGKDLFAIPGFINFPSYEGCNDLIKENKAKLITNGLDIVNEYLWDRKLENSKKIYLDEQELLILEYLKEELSIDELSDKISNGMDRNRILSIIMILKIKGLIIETGISKYIKII